MYLVSSERRLLCGLLRTTPFVTVKQKYEREYAVDAPETKTIKILFHKFLMTESVLKPSVGRRFGVFEEKV
jgi:hypothetical protein